MKLVVDTNILVSFFRPNPVNELISKSKFIDLQLFSPEHVIEELKKNKKDILKYSKLSAKQFNEKLKFLFSFVKIISKDLFKSFRKEAKFISPHDKDIPIFSLALKLNCAIWSNEPACQEPPVKDWWHEDATLRVVLDHYQNSTSVSNHSSQTSGILKFKKQSKVKVLSTRDMIELFIF